MNMHALLPTQGLQVTADDMISRHHHEPHTSGPLTLSMKWLFTHGKLPPQSRETVASHWHILWPLRMPTSFQNLTVLPNVTRINVARRAAPRKKYCLVTV